MRAAIYIAAGVIVAGCTTKTVEREVYYYVPTPAPAAPPLSQPQQNVPDHSTEIASLSFCARFFARTSRYAVSEKAISNYNKVMDDVATRLYQLGVRSGAGVLSDGIARADEYISEYGLDVDVLKICLDKAGWITTTAP